MQTLALDKFEALGNDFLVLADHGREVALNPELASALCARHRGIGADGLIRISGGPERFTMELWNADGTPAETSGNGLRCAALAAHRLTGGTEFVFDTAATASRCVVRPGRRAGLAEVRVEMGEARVSEARSPLPSRVAYRVNLGNPHLVLIGAGGDVEIGEIGPRLERAVPGGQNVELVTVRDEATLALEVYERGAGLTEACGSGSVAAAAAARRGGFVGEVVRVINPGGELLVELSGEPPSTALTGPARHVAAVSVELEEATALR